MDSGVDQASSAGKRRTLFSSVPAHYFLAALLFAIAILPMFLCSPLPIQDYPNHLARMHILSSIEDSPTLQKYYAVHWQIVPNLAMDVIVPLMARAIPVEQAMLLFTMLVFLLLIVGVYTVHWALYQKLSASPIAVLLFLYSREFFWGLLNYLFGLGVALLTFAVWVRLRKRGIATRLAVFAPLCAIVFFCHLSALGVLIVLVCGFELQANWQNPVARRWVVLLSVFFLIAVALVILLASPLAALREGTTPASFNVKLRAIMNPLNTSYNLPLDIAAFLIVSGTFFVGYVTRKAEFRHAMIVPVLGLILAYCVMPWGLFKTQAADTRLVLSIYLAALASTEWRLSSPRGRRILLLATVTLFVVRMSVIEENWRRASSIYTTELAIINQLPYGARLASAVGQLRHPFPNNPPLTHLPNMAVVRKDALVNSLFAERGEQIVSLRLPDADLPAGYDHAFEVRNDLGETFSRDNPYERIKLRVYDYLLVINKRSFLPFSPPPSLVPIYEDDRTILYRILHNQ